MSSYPRPSNSEEASSPRPVAFPSSMKPILLTVVHTEEEFDWAQPFDRAHNAVTNLRDLERGQEIFSRHGAIPVYMVDYPVVSQDTGIRALQAVIAGTGATIGAHLHPWVNPPFEETVSRFNSYPGNLPHGLEEAKLVELSERIEAAVGVRPRDYLAGRYGSGANTISILQKLGFRSDFSTVAMTDYSADGGPDFRDRGNFCCWEGDGDAPILRIPHNVADVGFLCRNATRPFAVEEHPFLRRIHLTGVLSRLGAVTRVRLTPEGFDLNHLQACALALVKSGVRVLVSSLHSPSLVPGCTPYVRDRADLAEFLMRIDRFLRFFRSLLDGEFCRPEEVQRLVEGATYKLTELDRNKSPRGINLPG